MTIFFVSAAIGVPLIIFPLVASPGVTDPDEATAVIFL